MTEDQKLLVRIEERLVSLTKIVESRTFQQSKDMEEVWEQIDLINAERIKTGVATKIGTWVVSLIAAGIVANFLPKILQHWIE